MAFLKFKYQHQLEQLEKLGYTDTKHIKKKLKKYNGDANQVIADYHKRDQILRHHAQSMSVSIQTCPTDSDAAKEEKYEPDHVMQQFVRTSHQTHQTQEAFINSLTVSFGPKMDIANDQCHPGISHKEASISISSMAS
eukprot:170973_1